MNREPDKVRDVCRTTGVSIFSDPRMDRSCHLYPYTPLFRAPELSINRTLHMSRTTIVS